MSTAGDLLTHSCDTDRGIRSTERGTLARIRSLVIQPAWIDVWICLDATGNVQATGRDAAKTSWRVSVRRS